MNYASSILSSLAVLYAIAGSAHAERNAAGASEAISNDAIELVSAAYQCSEIRNDPSIFGEGLILAKGLLLEAGFNDSEADEIVVRAKVRAENSLTPITVGSSCRKSN